MVMLAVQPPLHQEFRAGHLTLCSPGDGWRAYVPPPPPKVKPEFHFLLPLLDPTSYATVKPAPKPRPELDERLYGSCARAFLLPSETLHSIVETVVMEGGGKQLALASRYFHKLTLPHLYRRVRLCTYQSIAAFNESINNHPELRKCIRELHIEQQRLPWDEMNRMAYLLRDCTSHIHTLSLRIPASDLHLAIPFLVTFNPRFFSWSTSPCWLMQPGHLFVLFLSHWKNLQCLTLENFRFDETLVSCVSFLPKFQRLCLRGSGSKHIQAPLLHKLLLPSCTTSDTEGSNFSVRSTSEISANYTIEIADCSAETQGSLLHDLRNEIAGNQHDDFDGRLIWS